VVLNQLFGGYTGLSLIPITFDVSDFWGGMGGPLYSSTMRLILR
jgi:hypothetical protein